MLNPSNDVDASLRAWLTAEPAHDKRPPAVTSALAAPWCWPHNEALLLSARRRGHANPPPLTVGESLLAVPGALWRLSSGLRGRGAASLGPATAACLAQARDVAPSVLPHLHTLTPVEGLAWSVEPLVARDDDEAPAVLDDGALGLSLLLGLASSMMDRPLPARFAAVATLDLDGALGPVAALDARLGALADTALGVDTVIVSASQHDEALAVAVARGWSVEVVGVTHAREAVARVFPEARSTPPPAWRDDARASHAVDEVLALCRASDGVADWRAVMRSAAWLSSRFDSATTEREHARARFAFQLAARRDEGQTSDVPWDVTITERRELTRAAHLVQAAADAGAHELVAYLERARSLVDMTAPDHEALTLLGVIGNGLAALRRYDEASDVLAVAVRSSDDAHDRASSLAEWVRASSLATADAAWGAARASSEAYLAHAGHRDAGAWLVRLSLGRALVTRGHVAEALAALDVAGRAIAPRWLSRTWRRWQAIALARSGRDDEALALREAVRAEPDEDGGVCVESRFVALDEALARGDDPSDALRAVREANPRGVHWLFDDAITAAEQAERLAREYPY